MPLINLTSNLKDNKFGHDRIGGGSSNQPYIKTPIPEKIGEFGYLNQDFILRGGSKALTNSALDVVRLGKYFTDIRNPSGLLFTIKQNLLSRMAVRTQSSTGLLNEGIYTPLSTLIEAGGVAFGLHVNKQGLNPFGGVGGISTYSERVLSTQVDTNNAYRLNRLYQLYDVKILNNINKYAGNDISSSNNNILTYKGGPGSILGIGNTNIRFAGSSASERTGVNNPLLKDNPYKFFGYNRRIPLNEYLTRAGEFKSVPISTQENADRFLYLSNIWGIISEKYNIPFIPFNDNLPSIISSNVDNNTENLLDQNNNGTITYTLQDLIQIPKDNSQDGISNYIGRKGITTPGDFRKQLRKEFKDSNINNNNALIQSPDYSGPDAKNIEKRVNLGDPGNRSNKNLLSYTNGVGGGEVVGKSGGNASITSYDKINALPIYSDSTPDEKNGNDLVKFRIGVIDNDNPSLKTYIHFRAFLNQISDAYSADWNGTKYIGRGENFYTYGGFDRKVSLSWTVAAQSKAELIPMYKKLNYLASICTPDYSNNGYMRGNIVTLTVGGYFYEQPGIITGFSYDMNDDNATWEIGINDTGGSDDTVKELPHTIKVSGFNFTPIHTFVPRKQIVNYDPEGDILTDKNTYGKERYIALNQGTNNNYGPIAKYPKPDPVPAPNPNPAPSPNPTPILNPIPQLPPLAAATALTIAVPASTTPLNKSITAGQTNNNNLTYDPLTKKFITQK
jgi:hypothetical protein